MDALAWFWVTGSKRQVCRIGRAYRNSFGLHQRTFTPCDAIRLRAERRLGQMMAEQPKVTMEQICSICELVHTRDRWTVVQSHRPFWTCTAYSPSSILIAPAFRRGFYISAGPCGASATNAVRHSGSVGLHFTDTTEAHPSIPKKEGWAFFLSGAQDRMGHVTHL